jgi:putative membrane protein
MKRLLKHYIVNTFSLYVVSRIAGGLVFEASIETLLLTGGAITIATVFAKPVINVLLLPLNLVTFGVFRWVSSTIALYLVTLVVPGFSVSGFQFDGYVSKWIDIPSFGFSSELLAIIMFSFLLSVFSSLIYWIVK